MRNPVLLLAIVVVLATLAAGRDQWIELRSPNFVIVTNSNEKAARNVAQQFESIRAVFQDYWNLRKGTVDAEPVTIIAAKDESTLKGLLPEFWAKRGASHPVGYFLDRGDTNYIVLRLDITLNQNAAVPFEPIYHEYVHYMLRRKLSQLPLWMSEGLAELYGNTRIESKHVYLGSPSPNNLAVLRSTPLLPVSKLMDIDYQSPYYHEESKTSIFYAESWALTHLLITRDWSGHTHKLQDFFDSLRKGTDPRDAAKSTIGDVDGLDRDLREYIHKFGFLAMVLNVPDIKDTSFSTHPISDAMSLAVRADLLAHDRNDDRARTMLEEALRQEPKLEPAFETMSLVALNQHKVDEAIKFSEQALALNPKSFRANYYHAVGLLAYSSVDEQHLSGAAASLRATLQLNPVFCPAHDQMAFVLSQRSSLQDLKEAYLSALRAIEYDPDNIRYRVRAVEVMEKMGRDEDAVKLATNIVNLARTAHDKDLAESCLAGARQYQISKKKMQELEEQQKRRAGSVVSGTSNTQEPLPPGGSVSIFTDTMGVDLKPYVTQNVLPRIRETWYQLIPESASNKKGKVGIEFFVLKDGSIRGIKITDSPHDPALERPAWGAIQAVSPLPPLPSEFRGAYVGFRMAFYYNLSPQPPALQPSVPQPATPKPATTQ